MTQVDTFADIQQTLTQATQRATDLANAFNGKSTEANAKAAAVKIADANTANTNLAAMTAAKAPVTHARLSETITANTMATDANVVDTLFAQCKPKILTTVPNPLKISGFTPAAYALSSNDSTAPLPPLAPDNGLLHTLVSHIAEAMFLVNSQGVIEMINPQGAKLFGAPKDNIIGKKLAAFLYRDAQEEYDNLFEGWRHTVETQLNHGPKEVLLKRNDGQHLEVDLSLSCLPECSGNPRAVFIGIMHNLSSHKAEYKELRRLARTDSLTQLANRHAFDEVLQRSWNECANHDQPLSLVIIDVDYFKLFNDAHGHVQGDECLRRIAQVIQAALPSRHCLAARYGGEEFALILPGCNAHIAEATARRIQLQINKLSFTSQGLDASVSVSVSQGITCERDGQYRTPTALLCAADTALYRAKSDGRNRINVRQ